MGKRRYAKRKARATYRSMDKSMEYLLELKEMFAPDHPDLAKMVDALAQRVLTTQQAFSKWYGLCWSKPPDDWYSDV